MSESSSGFPELGSDDVLYHSMNLLGSSRLEPLAAFCSEEYLQRRLDGFRHDPNSMVCRKSNIAWGNDILHERRQYLFERHSFFADTPDLLLRFSALTDFFRVGFGIVDHTITHNHVSQAEIGCILLNDYYNWLAAPQHERRDEMRGFLRAYNAGMLAHNFLETDQQNTMIHYATAEISLAIPPTNNQASHVISPASDPEARGQVIEGTLAALFLLREHQVGQEMRDLSAKLTF